VGAAAGGYDFDALQAEGWTNAGYFDGTSYTPIAGSGPASTPHWDNENQEGWPFRGNNSENETGALLPLYTEGPVNLVAPSGRWRLELSSPALSDQSPFQNHSLVSFALLHTESGLPLWAEALLAVEKCDGTRGYVARTSTDDYGLCQPPPNKWTTCQFNLPLTGVQRVERVLIRLYYASETNYGITPVLDSVHAQ
jgi:hypothetical protein